MMNIAKASIRGFLIFLSLFILSGKEVSAAEHISNNDQTVTFILSRENVASWKENEFGFSILLTNRSQQNFYNLTRLNVNKPVKLYIEDVLVSSLIVREPIKSGRMMLSVQGELKNQARTLLMNYSNQE